MTARDWWTIAILQVITVPVVISLFRFAPLERRYIAVIAGAIFIGLGVFILKKVWFSGLRWKSLTFWAVSVHLLGSSLPLVVTRLIHFDKDFTQVLVLGMPGPVFHIYSERIYVGVFIATLIDALLLSRLRES